MEPWSATVETARFCGTRRAVTRVFTRVEVAGPRGAVTSYRLSLVTPIVLAPDGSGVR